MLDLRFQNGVGASWANLAIDIRSLTVLNGPDGPVVLAGTGPTGGVISFSVLPSGQVRVIDSTSFTPAMVGDVSGTATVVTRDGVQSVLLGGSDRGGVFGFSVSSDGQIGGAVTMDVPVFAGPGSAPPAVSTAGFVYAMTTEQTLQSFTLDSSGGFRGGQVVRDTDTLYLDNPAVLETVTVRGREFLLSLGGRDTGLSVFAIAPQTGALTATGSVGVASGLGMLSNPTGLEVVQIAGRCFVVIASAADHGEGGALSVVELGEDGALTVVDHVLDSRDTRFGRASDLAVTHVGDWTYVVAGGGDGGISLFVMIPAGRLIHMDSLADTLTSGLEQISALAMYGQGDALQILAGSQSTAGLSLIGVSLADRGRVLEAARGRLEGTPADDMLIGGDGNTDLRGGHGDDILIDGGGADTLSGGAGADLFVLGADGARDVITDFEPGRDRLDLSAVPMLYDSSRLRVIERPWGAVLVFPDGEETEIRSATGNRLTAGDIFAAISWGLHRPPLALRNERTGGDGADSLIGTDSTDLLFGLGGNDTLRGLAGDDMLIGGAGNDSLDGGPGDDRMEGGAGNDRMDGGPGNDWMHGGSQNDTLRGHDGDDTLIGGQGDDRLEGGNGHDHLDGGFGEDWLDGGAGDDWLLGGNMADTLIGGQGNDTLEGQYGRDVIDGGPGDDWIHGGAMADTIHGGTGNDTVNGGSGPDLIYLGDGDDLFVGFFQHGWLGRDTIWGGAGNDSIMASAGNDVAHGEDGDDFLFGGMGFDLLTGGRGNDTLQGGLGNDTLDGGPGNDRLEGGRGTDLLTGGRGSDVFVFRRNDDRNIVTDFTPGVDRLEFDVAARSLGDLKVVDAPRGVWIVWDGGEVLLEGVLAADLGSADVDFI